MRLENKVAIVVGAGQTPGPTIGNGRATALLFAREGARVLAVDRDGESAAETVEMIAAEGGESFPVVADVTDEASIAAAVRGCVERWGRIDVLHNNVGISLAGDDEDHGDVIIYTGHGGRDATTGRQVPQSWHQGSNQPQRTARLYHQARPQRYIVQSDHGTCRAQTSQHHAEIYLRQ